MSKPFTPDYWDEAKAHLSKKDKTLKKIIASYEGELMVTRGDAFYTLARAIAGQQISVKAADSIWKRLELATDKMTPKNMLALDEAALRAVGLSRGKALYMHSLAEHFIANKKRIALWPAMSDADIIAELTSIKGIGVWTAEMFLIFHLARPDVFPVLDLAVLKAIYQHYHGGKKVPLSEIRDRSEAWRPFRSVATWYLWRSLDPVPVAY